MSMDQYLAEIYGTPGGDTGQAENLEKAAEAELFVKLAADNGIDLNTLNDDQIAELYNETFNKEAAEMPFEKKESEEKDEKEEKKEEKEEGDDKEAAAQAEFLEKKAEQEKWAEADRMGRIMAHAYVQELGLIGNNLEKEASVEKEASTEEPEKKEEKQEKTASAIDELAVPVAIEKVAAEGWDKDEATQRVNAVFTLGLGESEKTASAGSVEEAVDTRALEFLEAAGYPVKWTEE